jgi:glycosyltransferase involved in cell wall biosynthesis
VGLAKLTAKLFISVVIPAYEEAGSIGDVVRGTKDTLNALGVNYQIIVVDSSASDETSEKAARAGAEVLRSYGRLPQGTALRKGFEAAKGDVVVMLDADGQHDPSEIPTLLEPITNQTADLVLGSRHLGRDGSTVSGMKRRLAEIILIKIMRLITRLPIADTQCGFRSITTDSLRSLKLRCNYTITSEMIIRASYAGLRIVEVPIHVRVRETGKSRTRSDVSYFKSVLYTIIDTVYRTRLRSEAQP